MTRVATLLALFALTLATPVVVHLAHRVEPSTRVSVRPVMWEESTTSTSTTSTTVAPIRSEAKSAVVTSRCGGDLPPCWVMMRESGGNIHAYNPTGCHEEPHESIDGLEHWGCHGKWQCSYSTCDGTGSEAEQDAEARRVWDGGRGCKHWAACR